MTDQHLPPRPSHEPLGAVQARPRRRVRAALLAGGVALALSGAGAAAVFAATDQATPDYRVGTSLGASVGPGAEAGSGKAGHGRHGARFWLRNALHGEFVVERDGSIVTVLTQRGTIEAVSGSALTVKSTDGFSQTYTLTAETEIRKFAAAAADGTFPRPANATAADLAIGDEVRIVGTKDGSTVTAAHVRAGNLPEPGEKRGGRGGLDGHRR